MIWSDRTTGRHLPIFIGTAYCPLISLTKLDDSSDGISKPKTVKTWLVNVFWVSVPYHKWPMNKVFLTKNISDLVTVRNSFQYQMYNKLLNLKSPLELYPVLKMISFFWGEMTKFSGFFSKGGGLFFRGGEMVSHGDSTVKWAKIWASDNLVETSVDFNFTKIFQFNKLFTFLYKFLISQGNIDTVIAY